MEHSDLCKTAKTDPKKFLTPRSKLTILALVSCRTGGERSIRMHGKHRRKAPRFLIFRAIAALLLVLVFSVSSLATVMANTVSAMVIDGNRSYMFSMGSADLEDILAQAQERGLPPLGPLDVAEQVGHTTTVNIRRGLALTVVEAGQYTDVVAYRGDTVEKTLEDNNVFLSENDKVNPSRNTTVMEGMTVEIRRACQVMVTADGESKELSLTGSTVADALEEAGVTLGEQDTVNYDPSEPLFNKMHIRVSRMVKITVTADGKTAEYSVSALTVRAALKKCGIELSEDDRLSVDGKSRLVEGMHIEVTRVTTREETETVEVEYPTQVLTSDSMYEDEMEVRTPGVKGEKAVTYKLIYVAGELEGKEVLSEEVLREPTPEVVVKGVKVREALKPSTDNNGVGGTIQDTSGNTLSYSRIMTGECTAYYPLKPGDLTSTGVVAGYGCVAVNPNVIPYGTKMYITSPDGSIVYGYGVAVDTGGAAMSGRILADLCYDTEAECSIIGRRNMVIYILN